MQVEGRVHDCAGACGRILNRAMHFSRWRGAPFKDRPFSPRFLGLLLNLCLDPCCVSKNISHCPSPAIWGTELGYISVTPRGANLIIIKLYITELLPSPGSVQQCHVSLFGTLRRCHLSAAPEALIEQLCCFAPTLPGRTALRAPRHALAGTARDCP